MNESDFINDTFASNVAATPYHLTSTFKAICIIFYSLLCVFSVYGNLLVILVILYFRRLRTATNILILNLALADLLIGLFCVPFSYWHVLIFDDQRWIFGATLCSLLAFLQGTAVYLSSWTLVVVSFDRWMAIMFVLSPSMRLTRKRAIYLVLTTWIFATIMALPLFLVSQQKEENGVYRCDENWAYYGENELPQQVYSYVVLALQYAVPQTVLIITYTFIGIKMWNSRVPGQSSGSTKKVVNERHESVKKLIPMVVLVSALFAVCWLPLLLLFNVVLQFWPDVMYWPYLLYLWWFCHGLAMLHSIVNPIVYFLRNARFREGFLFFSSRIFPFVKFNEFRYLGDNGRRIRSTAYSDGYTISTHAPRSHSHYGDLHACQCRRHRLGQPDAPRSSSFRLMRTGTTEYRTRRDLDATAAHPQRVADMRLKTVVRAVSSDGDRTNNGVREPLVTHHECSSDSSSL